MVRPADRILVDLHAHTTLEAIEHFRRAYDLEARSSFPRPLEVVHGYGSTGSGGIIRSRLRAFLQSQGERLVFCPGEQIDGNPGYTLVYPRGLLSTENSILSEQIMTYCITPHSEEKICGKFRRFGDSSVRFALRELERAGKLTPSMKGKHKHYTLSLK
jgi:hypothetical protein